MLTISLHRLGRKGLPYFRIVVSHVNRPNRAKACIGFYSPTSHQCTTSINLDEYSLWLTRGARPTKSVIRLHKSFSKLAKHNE